MKKFRILNSSLGLGLSSHTLTFFKTPMRFKSSLIMPLSQTQNPQIPENTELVDLFRTVRCKYDFLLRKYLVLGKSKIERGQHMESLADFDRVIELAIGDEVSNLSDEEKAILSEAYSCKAKILSMGSSADVSMALAHINKALKLVPNQKLAIECQQAILSENVAPIEIAGEEENKAKMLT